MRQHWPTYVAPNQQMMFTWQQTVPSAMPYPIPSCGMHAPPATQQMPMAVQQS